jgi:hypothetical protein
MGKGPHALHQVVARQPCGPRGDLFTHHVKSHIFEMECRAHEGRDWLAKEVGNWPGGNQ